ncbi:MAG: extracellular solute-binding protein [Clostridiales bacterium]|jgi:multiple sugar transport system substrate-binding protein|nr:extracellular solute-binding protein [Clostridiales bacterium]
MAIFNKLISVMLVCAMIISLHFDACFRDPRTGLSAGKEKVVFWTPPFVEVQTREWFTKWTDKYNEENDDGIYVELNFIPEDAWAQSINAARADGNAPDLVFANYAAVPLEGNAGYYVDLNEYFSEDEWSDIHGYVENMINVKGTRYIYPAFVEPYSVLYYSKSKFAAVGLDPEKPPKTWDELIDYAERLTNNLSGSDKVYGIQLPPSGQLGWVLWGFQGMAGSELLNENWDTPIYDTAFNRGLFEMFRTIYKNGWSPKTSAYTYNEINQFANGRVAMQPCGSWGIGQIKNGFPGILDDVGIAKFPTPDGDDGVSTAALGGWGMTVSTDSKKPELAVKFMKYLLAGSEEIMVDFFQGLGYSKFSGRKSVDAVLNTGEYAGNDVYSQYMLDEILPLSVPEPCYPWSFSDTFAIKLQEYMLQSGTIDSVMASLGTLMRAYVGSEETAGKNPRKA